MVLDGNVWNLNSELKYLDSAWLNVPVSSSRQISRENVLFLMNGIMRPLEIQKKSLKLIRFSKLSQVTFYWFKYKENCILSVPFLINFCAQVSL